MANASVEKSKMEAIKVGDVVRIRGTSVNLTVLKIHGRSFTPGEGTVEVSGDFKAMNLEKVEVPYVAPVYMGIEKDASERQLERINSAPKSPSVKDRIDALEAEVASTRKIKK